MAYTNSVGAVIITDSDDEMVELNQSTRSTSPCSIQPHSPQTPAHSPQTKHPQSLQPPSPSPTKPIINHTTSCSPKTACEMVDLTLDSDPETASADNSAPPLAHPLATGAFTSFARPAPHFAPPPHPHSPVASTSAITQQHPGQPHSDPEADQGEDGSDEVMMDVDEGDVADIDEDGPILLARPANTHSITKSPKVLTLDKGKGRQVPDSSESVKEHFAWGQPSSRHQPGTDNNLSLSLSPGPNAHSDASASGPRPRRRAALVNEGHYDDRKRTRMKVKSASVKSQAGHASQSGSARPPKVRKDYSIENVEFVSEDHVYSAERKAAYVAREQSLPSKQRRLCGPKLEGEFDGEPHDVHEYIALYEPSQKRINKGKVNKAAYTRMYEDMIADANAKELNGNARIRIVPQAGNKEHTSPPFECIWTNRAIYVGKFLPVEPTGCGCKGNCADPSNFDSCACRKRQELAYTSRTGGEPRSNATGFAYDKNGLLQFPGLVKSEPTYECNSHCGCGPECQNRVVGNRPSIAIDIYHTPNQGWAVRNPPDYSTQYNNNIFSDYQGKVIKKGTVLGIYAGEVITASKSDKRSDVYDKMGRNYDYSLDHWVISEEFGHSQAGEESETTTSHRRTTSVKDTQTRTVGNTTFTRQETVTVSEMIETDPSSSKTGYQWREGEYKTEFSIDAFHYGNWTRFCNHKCNTSNAAARPVYIDDVDPRRPLWVFFATQDIKPGEEITISYHDQRTGWAEVNVDPKEVAKCKRQAITTRKEASDHLKCFCGDDICLGTMFGVFDPADEDEDEDEDDDRHSINESDDEFDQRVAGRQGDDLSRNDEGESGGEVRFEVGVEFPQAPVQTGGASETPFEQASLSTSPADPSAPPPAPAPGPSPALAPKAEPGTTPDPMRASSDELNLTGNSRKRKWQGNTLDLCDESD